MTMNYCKSCNNMNFLTVEYCIDQDLCNGYRIWIIKQALRNSEHHLLNSMSSGEHPLIVGT